MESLNQIIFEAQIQCVEVMAFLKGIETCRSHCLYNEVKGYLKTIPHDMLPDLSIEDLEKQIEYINAAIEQVEQHHEQLKVFYSMLHEIRELKPNE